MKSNSGSSDRVRAVALQNYVKPALQAGVTDFSIAVRDLMRDLRGDGFPATNTPQICTAIRKESFLRENGLEIVEVQGPPSKQSTTVVVKYRMIKPSQKALPAGPAGDPTPAASNPENETPEARAHRLTEALRGLMKEELAQYGGGEAFLRWVRGYDEEDAA